MAQSYCGSQNECYTSCTGRRSCSIDRPHASVNWSNELGALGCLFYLTQTSAWAPDELSMCRLSAVHQFGSVVVTRSKDMSYCQANDTSNRSFRFPSSIDGRWQDKLVILITSIYLCTDVSSVSMSSTWRLLHLCRVHHTQGQCCTRRHNSTEQNTQYACSTLLNLFFSGRLFSNFY